MPRFFTSLALLPGGWAENVLITTDERGYIEAVSTGDGKNAAISDVAQLDGPVIPAMPNLHSHAFQRAMAGLTEYATGARDSFWSWRSLMYDFVGRLEAPELEEIAFRLYRDMRAAGYGHVCEFHYLHHRPDGQPYDDRAALARAMIRAAQRAGLGITILPVLYACGGFGGTAPEEGQKRFINKPEHILEIINTIRSDFENDPLVQTGLAFHSLRAVTPEMITETLAGLAGIAPDLPVHIHIAEQTKEVEDCRAWSGKRPVEWLLDNAPLGPHWCLVHATHMSAEETAGLAASGAVAGLCPTTEANLGDGLFNLPTYIAAGGRFGIGSDSHISVDPAEELRWLEYGQRLHHQARAIARTDAQPHCGLFLYRQALQGGAQASGLKLGQIAPGCRADFCVLDNNHPLLQDRDPDFLLDTHIFSGGPALIKQTIVAGKP